MFILMTDLSKVVDSLEYHVAALLERQDELKQINKNLEARVEEMRKQKLQLEKELIDWQEQVKSLKYANSLLGSDQYKRETKLKINALVREIDQCIAQLST